MTSKPTSLQIAAVKQLEASRAVKELAREMGVTDQTLYNWKSKYGGMEVSDAKRLKSLEDENRRLKGLVADLSLDKEALTTVIRKMAGACERPAGRGAVDGGAWARRALRWQAPGSGPLDIPV